MAKKPAQPNLTDEVDLKNKPTSVVVPDTSGRAPIVSDPLVTFIAGSTDYAYWQTDRALPQSIDDAERQHGLALYDRMLTESVLAGVERYLKIIILADGFKLMPSHPEPAVKDADAEAHADYETATQIRDYCEAVIADLNKRQPLYSFLKVLWNLLDAARLGHKIAELTYDTFQNGPWVGRMRLEAFRCKPRQNYSFVLDEFNGFRGVSAKVPGGSMIVWSGLLGDASKQPNTIAPEKIVVFCLEPEDGSPIGRSWFRAAYDPYYRKQKLKPEEIRTGVQFGGGSIDVILPEEKAGVPVIDPDTGLPTTLLKNEQKMLQKAKNGGARVHPNGTTVQVNQPNANPDFFESSFDRHDREMVTAFLIQARSMIEAKHGSKADGGSANDVVDELKRHCQGALCDAIKTQVLHRLIRMSWDEETADKFCPVPIMQTSQAADFAANAPGIEALVSVGALTKPELDQAKKQKLGIEPVEGDIAGPLGINAAVPDDLGLDDPDGGALDPDAQDDKIKPNAPAPTVKIKGGAGKPPAGFRRSAGAVPNRSHSDRYGLREVDARRAAALSRLKRRFGSGAD